MKLRALLDDINMTTSWLGSRVDGGTCFSEGLLMLNRGIAQQCYGTAQGCGYPQLGAHYEYPQLGLAMGCSGPMNSEPFLLYEGHQPHHRETFEDPTLNKK